MSIIKHQKKKMFQNQCSRRSALHGMSRHISTCLQEALFVLHSSNVIQEALIVLLLAPTPNTASFATKLTLVNKILSKLV